MHPLFALQALNKTGKVIKVYADGDLRIQQIDDGFAWTLNPKCVKLERSTLATATERSNSMMDLSHQRTDHVMMPLSGLSGSSAADKLVREAAQGKLAYVQTYLDQNPDQVDVMSAGKTCLQVSAHQGHLTQVSYLLGLGANVNVVDKEGDSTLHYAAFGNQPEVMKVLLAQGADINVLNASHCSALHISAHKKPPHCVRILLEHGADVNIQDSYGDTALHDAIGKENTEVVELLCGAPDLNLTVRNNRGFNALHHASLKGNVTAARRILALARQLVDVKKDDGFAALHLAALNGHAAVVEVLVRDGQADIDVRNNRQQTPFLLAVSQGHAAAIERLAALGCDISAKDEDGDNAMHLCVIKKSNLVQEITQTEAPQIWEIYQSLQHITENRLMCAILCYLVKNGCGIEANNKGKNILDWVWDKASQDLILSYVNKAPITIATAAAAPPPTAQPPAPSQQHQQPPQPMTAAEDLEQQIYSNIQMLNRSGVGGIVASELGSNSSSANTSLVEPQLAAVALTDLPSSSNPPTPMRRATNREQITPSPSSNPFIQYVAVDENQSSNQSIMPKKQQNTDRNHTLSPPPPPPQADSGPSKVGADHANHSENEFGRTTTKPYEANAATVAHQSRKDQNNQFGSALPTTVATTTAATNKIINQSIVPVECIVCNEMLPLAIFEPCGHQISCVECALRMKKCLSCGIMIEKRMAANGRDVLIAQPSSQVILQVQPAAQPMPAPPPQPQRQPSVDRLRYLESKILEIEETHCCSICMERRRNVAFLCGHGACSKCADTLKTCHMCRKTIAKKINLY